MVQVATVILNYEFSKLSAAAVTLKRGAGVIKSMSG